MELGDTPERSQRQPRLNLPSSTVAAPITIIQEEIIRELLLIPFLLSYCYCRSLGRPGILAPESAWDCCEIPGDL